MKEHSNTLHIKIKKEFTPLVPEENNFLSSTLLLGAMEFFCVLFVSLGSIGCLLDILKPDIALRAYVVTFCILWSLFFTVLFHLKGANLWAILSLLLFIYYLYKKQRTLIGGGKYFSNLALHEINSYYRINLPSFSMNFTPNIEFTLLLGCIIFLLILLFTYTLVRHKKTAFIIGMSLFFPLSGLMVGLLPSKNSLFLTILSLFFTISLGNRRNFYGKGRTAVYAICCAICMFLTLLCLPMAHWISEKTAPSLLQYHSTLLNAEKAVEASIVSGSWYYDLFLSGSFPLFSSPPGTLNNNQPNFSEIPIMEITLDMPPNQSIYLKDWVGGTYKNNAWSSISEENFAKLSETFSLEPEEDAARRVHDLSYQHFQALDPYISYASSYASYGGTQENTLTITKLQSTMSEVPFPYFCKMPDNAVPVADGYYSKETPFEQITYCGYPLENGYLLYNMLPNLLEESDIALEKTYRDYVYQEYQRVPTEGLNRIKALCAAKKPELITKKRKVDTSLAIDFVTGYLAVNAVYSTNLSNAPLESDILDDFLFEQKKGFCVHFASTATIMFRMLGIPSRYVTGYMIPATAFKSQKTVPDKYKAIIKDSFAHAWPEVYLDGIGWVPIESTPGNSRSGADQPLASLKPSTQTPDSPSLEPDPIPTVTPSPAKDEIPPPSNESLPTNKASSPVTGIQIPRWMFLALFCLLFFLLVIFVIQLRRKIIITKRVTSIHQKDTKKAAESICYEVYRLLKFDNQIQSEFTSDAAFTQYIQHNVPCFEHNDFITFAAICEKALFSKEGINESELSFCQNIYFKLLAYETIQMKQKNNLCFYLFMKYFIVV